MTCTIDIPERLGEEFAHRAPASRRAVYDACHQLAQDPTINATPEPVRGADLRHMTINTGDRIILLYRIHTEDTGWK
ncbi:hypothetical protein [Streptomyces sp. H39-S7]|uniref:hypothetical protein n=1 Tax=Streptomyces sp. H39-S7 TaxID=3004357 RepID=UPI0022AF767E|nr:hypothetical protein [Streptomyces sp. H39-S7]MCZ4125568.1 hypothetical protein [Streptomyces sp. H39-S7]